MKIVLLRAFPDPYRQSMIVYADRLLESLRSAMSPAEEIAAYLPKQVALTPRLARYWSQYVGYQLMAHFAQGDINHVIDHSFGHLVYSLNARRTVVAFHDATIFKAADGTINGCEVPKRTVLSLRYSLAAIKRAAAVIAISEVSRKDFISLTSCDHRKIHVIYPGVDPSFCALEARSALKARYGLDGKHILHVGHNLFYMNIEGVLRTLHHLVFKLGVDAKLLKVGMPFTNAQNRLMNNLKLHDRVVFLGHVASEDLPRVYNCADALLYPVHYAGFGLPPVEAMACGTPVVCSNRGSLPEITGGAALMADPENYSQLAKHLASLLTDTNIREIYRAKGLEQAKRYSWEKTAKETLAVYKRIYESNA